MPVAAPHVSGHSALTLLCLSEAGGVAPKARKARIRLCAHTLMVGS